METIERGARVQKANFSSKFSMYFRNHANDCASSIRELRATPIATLMTLLVLGIALALPAGLHLILKNSQSLTQGWDNSTKISLFLHENLSPEETAALISKLELRADVAKVTYIDSDQALIEFQKSAGFGDAIAFLDQNPLPDVIELTPSSEQNNPAQAEIMLKALRDLKEVEIAQLDLEWVKKLHSMLAVAQKGTQVIAVLFGLAVLLIVGNTIRLAIQNKREEIEIIKLVGATDGFIQRPFLYSGLWYGIGGGLLAWFILTIALFSVDDAINSLVALYDSSFELSYLSAAEVLYLVLIASSLGLLGSWASVSRHLKAIQPH